MDAPKRTITHARALRRRMTPPELRLWTVLRARPYGFKFRRQHPIGRFVLDFYCAEARLAVEVDGAGHDADRDAKRDAWLNASDVRVLRVDAEDVRANLEGVMQAIELLAGAPSTAFRGPPPPEGEETQRSKS